MSNCKSDVLFHKLSAKKLEESREIEFRIRKDLPDCKKLSAGKVHAFVGTANGVYDGSDRPENQLECMRKGCINSGTLTMNAANDAVDYFFPYNATEFSAGVLTFYVKGNPTNVTVSLSDDAAFTNTNTYTVAPAAAGADGFRVVFIDLSQPPTSTEGTGWVPSSNGVYVRVSSDAVVGYSSFAFFDSIEDFELLDVVKVACLTTMGGSFDLNIIEEACTEVQYNSQITSLNFPLTGRQVTPNYHKLNPMLKKGTADEGFEIVTVEKTVDTNGRIQLTDMDMAVCGYTAVQLNDACDVASATLTQINAPIAITLDASHFQILPAPTGAYVYLNQRHANKSVLVSYPRRAEVEEYEANVNNLNSVHTSMVVPYILGENDKYLYIFDNVYVTSFPMAITSDTAEFAFTITIGRGEGGTFYRVLHVRG